MRFAGLMVAVALAASAFSASGAGLQMEQVAPGNYVHYGVHAERSPENLGDNANIGFIVGDKCVAVIDTGGSRAIGDALREAIRSVTPLPVCYVVITHVHPDHFFGAAAFAADDPQFVGHAELPAAFAARGKFYVKTLERDLGDKAKGGEVIVPKLLVKGEQTLDLGNRILRVRAWPIAHTDNDLTVFDERTGTLWLSDLLFLQHTPVVDGSILGFLKVLDVLKAVPAQRVVAGHGRSDKPWPGVLEDERRYLESVATQTRKAVKSGRTIQQAVESVGLEEEPHWVNFDTYHRRNVTSAFTELEWEE